MGTINITDISDGTTADADDVNSRFDIVADEINGNLDNANIASSAAIDGSKLADDSVARSKLELPIAFDASVGETDQTISASTWTKVELTHEEYDLGDNFDNVTDYRFTAPSEGLYQISAFVHLGGTATRAIADIRVNGNSDEHPNQRLYDEETNFRGHTGSIQMKLAASDYIELWVYLTGGTGVIGRGAGSTSSQSATRLQGRYLGPTA